MIEENQIHLRGMEFYGYHGVLPQEQDIGQRFIVDVDIFPVRWVDGSDNLTDTINYAEVFSVIQTCVSKEKYQLLESLAERIASQILETFNCFKVRVEVHKPQAPIPGIFKDVSVEIIREKKR